MSPPLRDLTWLLFWRSKSREDREALQRTLDAIRALPTAKVGR